MTTDPRVDEDLGAAYDALRLGLALEAGRLGTWHWDMGAGTVRWDARLEEIFGYAPGGFDGSYESYVSHLHPDERPAIQARVRRAVEAGESYDVEHRIIRADGTTRWIQGLGGVTTNAAGDVTGTIGCVADITDRKLVEAEREGLFRRLAFLAEASAILAQSLDLGETLRQIAALAVPSIGDVAAVWLLGEDGEAELATFHTAGDDRDESRRTVLDAALPIQIAAARAEAGDLGPVVVRGDGIEHELHRRILDHAGLGDGVFAPIVVRRRVLGLLALAVEPERELTHEAAELAGELGRRLANSVENAILYRSARTVADALQAGLAPPAPPPLVGLNVAVRYAAAGEGVEIGGDFYDFVTVPPDRHFVVVGDVCGRGPSAASVNAQVRFASRALARAGLDVVELASAVNRNLYDDVNDHRFCTAVLASLQRRGDGVAATTSVDMVVAGHPSPVIVRASGQIEAIGSTGPLLGIRADAVYESTTVVLGAKDALVIVTDGLLEARNQAGAFFEPAFEPLLATVAGRDADTIANTLLSAVTAFTGGPVNDDVAVVVLQPSPST